VNKRLQWEGKREGKENTPAPPGMDNSLSDAEQRCAPGVKNHAGTSGIRLLARQGGVEHGLALESYELR